MGVISRWFREFAFICVPACTVSTLLTEPEYWWSAFAMGAWLGLMPFAVRTLDAWERRRAPRVNLYPTSTSRRTLQ